MKTEAEYEYEYYAFNEDPQSDLPVEWQYEYLFTEPVRVFGIGPNALVTAEAWVRDANAEREDARKHVQLDVDRAGWPRKINLEVRRRLIIKLGYERIKQSNNPRLSQNHIESVNENWVSA
jgi:hypothetical protein